MTPAPADGYEITTTDWGRLVWMVSGEIGNSETMTFGRCYIDPGRENPRHYHPNCDEIVHVIDGTVDHSIGDTHVLLGPGDTLAVPAMALHNARNVGAEEAVFVIAFSSPSRRVEPESSGPGDVKPDGR